MKNLIILKIFLIFIFTNINFFKSYADNFTNVKEYLLNLKSMEADFFQVYSDGNIKEGKIFVIEVNPRASRTIPFVSKSMVGT